MHLDIPKNIEASLRSRAEAAGFCSAEQYVLSVLNPLDPSDNGNSSKQTSEEWIAKLRAFAARHQPTGTPLDDSRENMYD